MFAGEDSLVDGVGDNGEFEEQNKGYLARTGVTITIECQLSILFSCVALIPVWSGGLFNGPPSHYDDSPICRSFTE